MPTESKGIMQLAQQVCRDFFDPKSTCQEIRDIVDRIHRDEFRSGELAIEMNEPRSSHWRIMLMAEVASKLRRIESDDGRRYRVYVDYVLAGKTYTIRYKSTRRQPGSGRVEGIGCYYQIFRHIDSLWLNDKTIAHLMTQSRRTGRPITSFNLEVYDTSKEYGESYLEENAKFLNQLNFLLDFEVARRLPEDDVYHKLPVALAIATMQSNIRQDEDAWAFFIAYNNVFYNLTKYRTYMRTPAFPRFSLCNIFASRDHTYYKVRDKSRWIACKTVLQKTDTRNYDSNELWRLLEHEFGRSGSLTCY